MTGFVGVGEKKAFTDVLWGLDNLGAAWGGPERRVYKFGATVEDDKLEGVQDAASSSFYYERSDPRNYTNIEGVVGAYEPVPDRDRLMVIVTDLFPDKGNTHKITRAIGDEVFERNLAVGILAVRLPFSGRIYDVMVDRNPLYFDHTGLRPLYLLVIGRRRAVEFYCQGLFDQMRWRPVLPMSSAAPVAVVPDEDSATPISPAESVGPLARLVVFSPQVVSRVATFTPGMDSAHINLVRQERRFGPNAAWYEWRDQNEPASIVLTWEPTYFPYGPSVRELACHATPVLSAPRKTTGQWIPSSTVDFSPTAKAIVGADGSSRLALQVSLDPIPDGSCAAFDVRLRAKTVAPPAWVADWSFGRDDIELVGAGRDAQITNGTQLGPQTMHYEEFCRSLADGVASSRADGATPALGGPEIGHFSWIVGRR
ncbi:hypothetical protein HOI71_19355 [Candidatus Poribacteria bacterium]|nr:hypothetical protein [Candidatus Poribacteria bacterium]